MNLYNKVINSFNNSTDLIIRKIDKINIIYLESLCSSDKINDYIIKFINRCDGKLDSVTLGANVKILSKYNDIMLCLLNGFTIIFSDKVYGVETKGDLIRGVDSPTVEADIYGAKDSFNESIQTNLGLIKRRIKSDKLCNIDYNIGEYTKTKLSVLYIKDIVREDLLNKVILRINKIKNNIIDAGNIRQLISLEDRTIFPTNMFSERPDKICNDLLEGKIVILVDNSCFVLSMPAFFFDFINPNGDTYNKNLNVNFLKIIRFICLIMTMFLPALYISLITYNQGSIPIKLLINFKLQRDGVPYPSIIECLFILILCAILRESDIRFPSSYGSSLSIVGALILGDAAVSAGIVSPIMIIVIAITFISSMVFTDMEFINSLRYIRFISLLFVGFMGLFGLYLFIFMLVIHLADIMVLNIPYTYPVSPFDINYFKNILFRGIKKNSKSSKILSKESNKI